jgi:hypothetical protein
MTHHLRFDRSFLAAAALLLAFTTGASAATLPKADYAAGKKSIAAEYKAAKADCKKLSGNAEDVCIEQAKAKEKVALAELEFSYTGKPADEVKIAVARGESDYAVAKEKCDDLKGNDKDVCVKQAKAVEVKALADARLTKTIGTARTDAAQDVRDAEYKLAAEKCEAIAGDARVACISAAKAKFGKT